MNDRLMPAWGVLLATGGSLLCWTLFFFLARLVT